MKIIDAFVILTPLAVARLSDSFSLGFTDVAWLLFLPLLVQRFQMAFNNAPAVFSGLFLAALLLSSAINFAQNGGGVRDLAILRVFFIMVPFLYALTLQPNLGRLYRLSRLFIIFGGTAIGIGILLHIFGIQIKSNQQMLWFGDGAGPRTRAGGILGNSSDYGLFASSWGSICGLLALALFPRRRWIWFLVIAAVSTYAVWISASRSGLLHLAIAWGIGVPFLMRRHNWAVGALVALMALPLALLTIPGVTLFMPESIAFTLRRLDFLNLSGDTTFYQTIRLVNWGYLFGIGLENWTNGIGYKAIARNYGDQGIYGDNAFLTIFVEFGIFTVLFYIAFWVSLLWSGLKHFRASAFGVILTAVVASEMFHSFTLDTFTVWYSMPLMWFFVALIYRCLRLDPVREVQTHQGAHAPFGTHLVR